MTFPKFVPLPQEDCREFKPAIHLRFWNDPWIASYVQLPVTAIALTLAEIFLCVKRDGLRTILKDAQRLLNNNMYFVIQYEIHQGKYIKLSVILSI